MHARCIISIQKLDKQHKILRKLVLPMARTELTEKAKKFIIAQKMFFVATAAPDGRVNVSPKGLDSLRILSNNRIVWLNLSGSGNETAAHLQELNRITLMFCAFEGEPWIFRVYGTAKVIHPRDSEWEEFVDLFPPMAGSRQIFDIEIELTQGSCGTGVPFFEFQGQRGDTELVPYFDDLGKEGVEKFWEQKNSLSLDGKATNIF